MTIDWEAVPNPYEDIGTVFAIKHINSTYAT